MLTKCSAQCLISFRRAASILQVTFPFVHHIVEMSVVTALSFAFLLVFSPLTSVSAAPEAKPPPVYVTTTEPCDECEYEQPTQVHTVSTSTCTTSRSVIPYTSGSATYYITTKTLTEQATCETSPQGYGETETVTSTKTMYGNNTNVAPVGISTIQVTVPTTETETVTSWKRGKPPATVTLVSTQPVTEQVTVTKYQSGPAPKSVTVTKTINTNKGAVTGKRRYDFSYLYWLLMLGKGIKAESGLKE